MEYSIRSMSCCICMGSDNVITVKCCNKHFHADCLNQWLQQKKFTCPMCRNVKDFMGSLPCIRQAISEGLDAMFRTKRRCTVKISNIFCGFLLITTYPEETFRLTRSRRHQGFFFDFRGSKIWIRVEYYPSTNGNPVYRLYMN
jgi:hypothetical protein